MPDFQPLSDDELNALDPAAPVIASAPLSDAELNALDPDPADVKGASQDRARFVSLNNEQRAAGLPQISTRGDFAPDFSKKGLRNYIADFSQGDLDLDDSLLPKAKFDSEAAKFYAAHPSYKALVRNGSDEDRKALDDHVRVLTHLNHTPASPREANEALHTSVSDWYKAAASGRLMDPAGKPIPVNPQVPPQLAADLGSKLINLPRGEWPTVLTKDDSAALDALGGERFISHLQSTNLSNVKLSRKERLLGAPVRDPNADPASFVDTRSPTQRAFGQNREVSLDLSDLEHVSSFARNLLYATAEARGQDAEYIAGAYKKAGTVGLAVAQANGFLEHPDQNATTALLVTGGNLLARTLPEAIDKATLGGFSSVVNAATSVEKGISKLATGDPDTLARSFRTKNQSWTRSVAMGNANFGSSIGADVEAIESSFPNMSDDARLELRQSAYSGAKTIEQFVSRLPIAGRSEALNKQLGENFGFLFEEPAQAVLAAVGAAHSLKRAAKSVGQVANLYRDHLISKEVKPFSTLVADAEATAAEIEKNPALAQKLEIERAQYLDGLSQKIGSIGDARHAQAFASRFERALKEDARSLTPDFVAETTKSIEDLKTRLGNYSDTKLTAEDRAALADLSRPLGELHPIDQHFVVTGQDAYINKAGSLERIRRSEEALKAWSAGSDAIETPRLMDRPAPALAQIKTGLFEHSERARELANRKTQLATVLEDTTAGIGFEIAEEQRFLEEHMHQRDVIHQEWDAAVRPAITDAIRLDREGGVVDTVNPGIKSRLHDELARAVDAADPLAAERILRNHRLVIPERAHILAQVDELASRQAAELQEARQAAIAPKSPDRFYSAKDLKALREKDPAAFQDLVKKNAPNLIGNEKFDVIAEALSGRRLKRPTIVNKELIAEAADNPLRDQLILSWAEDRLASLQEPIKKTIAPHDSPNTGLHTRLEEKLASGQPITLTSAERDWLNVRRRTLGQTELTSGAPGGIAWYDRQIERSIKRISERETLALDLHKASQDIAAATLDNPKLEISKDLRKRLETHLGEKSPILGKRFLSIAPDASQLEVSALQAMKESLDGYSAEARAIQAGYVRMASFESSLVNPKALRWELADRDREARGQFTHEQSFAKSLSQKFGREFSAKERQQIFHDLKAGVPTTNESVALLQEHRFRLLAQAVDAGVITPEQYAAWVDAPYAHNFFDRATESKLASIFEKNQARLPPGYKLFKIEPASLKHRIPENGDFFIHAKDSASGKFITRDGFASEAEAASWLKDNVTPGSDASIQRTMSAIEKEVKLGLVTDAAASHLRLTEDLSFGIHNARVSANLHAAGQVKRLTDLQATSGEAGRFSSNGDIFYDGNGDAWHRFTGQSNRWLEGKYVSASGYKYLTETKEGFGIWSAANEGINDVLGSDKLLDPATYKPSATVAKFLKSGIRIPGNLAAANLILLNPKTWVSGWRSNLSNLAVAGLDIFNPAQTGKIVRYTAEAFRTAANRVGNPIWDFLEKNDHLRFPDSDGWKRTHEGHSVNVTKELDRNWRSVDAIEARLERLRAELPNQIGNPDLQAATAAEIARLGSELTEATKPATRSFWGRLTQNAVDFTNAAWDAAQGKGKVHAAAWYSYSWGSGDIPTKYALAKHLLEDEKLPPEKASRIIFDYTQHLHAVPATAQKLSRTFGGAMYSSFAIDRLRTLRNTLTNPAAAGRLGLQLSRLAGWNTLALNTSGVDPEHFLEARSIAAGDDRRSLPTDVATLLSSTLIPGDKGVNAISTGPLLWDIFKPSSPMARSMSEKIHASGAGPEVGLAADAVVGTLSKYFGADLIDLLTGPLLTQKDDQGQPLTNVADYGGYLMRMLVPGARLVAGREAASVARAFDEKDIDLHTNRPKPMLEAVANLLVNVRPEMRSPDRFRIALNREARDNDTGMKFISQIKEDELLSSLVSRDANDGTGKIDRGKALQIIKSYLAQNPQPHHVPGGATVYEAFDPREAGTRLDDLALAPTIRSFKRMGLADNFNTIANWLAIDPEGPRRDPDWFGKVRQVVVNKLIDANEGRRKPVDLEDARKVFTRIKEAELSRRLTPDNLSVLHSLAGLIQVREPR